MIRLAHNARTLIVLLLVGAVGFVTLRGQQDTPDSGQQKALVSEVRALRLAIERAAASTSQSQLLLGRVQLQENRLAILSRQYQEARGRTMDAQMAQAELEHQLQRTQAGLESSTQRPPEERQALEDRITQLKGQVARQQARTAQLRADETGAADVLATEQQRWADFNQRLESIERTLSDSLSAR
jgi:chromosome segregation ATPase